MNYPPTGSPTVSASKKVTFDVSNLPGGVAQARAFVRVQCVEAGFDDDLCHLAMLLTSEAVTNALLHAGPRASVDITVGQAGLWVEIDDDAPGPVRLQTHQSHPDLRASGGRGLFILSELATEWGSYDRNRGKVVWFHLAAERSPDGQG